MTDPAIQPSSILAERFRIERKLGSGGMATVYLAVDLKHDREVALKVLRPALAAVLGAERFLQEIRISAKLDHPHILTLIDSGDSDGRLWYVLPYVRGESLREKLTREKQLPIETVVGIATQIASALDYAHRHGVIHRDVKPENILLHEGEAMVADFGIALAVSEAAGPRITESGLALGTPQYMSPEQATAGRELDARSDVYSLGAVVYEMLTGEPPHTGATAQAIIAKVITERPTQIRTVRDTVPEHVDSAVARALAKVPADRYASTMEFATALTSPRQGPTVRRHLTIAASIAAMLFFATIAAVWHPWRRALNAIATDNASVAVMPFRNLTGKPEYQYLSDGMTEEVIGQLARVLKVISRTSTEALRDAHLTTRQIADTLHVRTILEGSLRQAGNQLRVSVDLIDATTDGHLWSASYDRNLAGDPRDVFTVEEEIARHVADSLVNTVGTRPNIGRVSRTSNPAALAAYQEGRNLMKSRTRDAVRGAADHFLQAIALDSTYAPAYAGLATAYYLWVFYDYPGMEYFEAYGRAWAMADRAIALDSSLAEPYAGRGYVATRSWAPSRPIADDFARALALRPNSADIHQWYANFLSREARHGEAIVQAERAIDLDPIAPGVRVALVIAALAGRRYELIEPNAAEALALAPSLTRARAFQALGDLLSEAPNRCVAMQLGAYAAIRALCLNALGRANEAAQIADSLRKAFSSAINGDTTFNAVAAARGLAEYSAWTGNADEAIHWLERAYDISPVGEDPQVIDSSIYDKVRNDDRFKSGLQKIHERILERVIAKKHSVEQH